MAERVLKSRRRKASKGQLIRVSDLVYGTLDQARRRRGIKNTARVMSWDEFFRRTLGLPDRSGTGQPLVEGMLEVHSGAFILRMPDTPWKEIEELAFKIAERNATKARKVRQAPLRMREMR